MTLLADILHDEDEDAAYWEEMEAEDAPFDSQLTGDTLDAAIADVLENRKRFGRPVFASVDENDNIFYRYADTLEVATL